MFLACQSGRVEVGDIFPLRYEPTLAEARIFPFAATSLYFRISILLDFEKSFHYFLKNRARRKATMKKNRAKPPAMLLLEFVTDQRSNIYAEMCAASTDANRLQSDEAGALLRSEIESVLRNLLSGRNFDVITENLARYATLKPPEIRLRAVGTSKSAYASDLFSTTKSIRLGSNKVFVDTSYDPSATAHQLIYGVLKRAIETNDIERLGNMPADRLPKTYLSKIS
jgi:hypothetical protein